VITKPSLVNIRRKRFAGDEWNHRIAPGSKELTSRGFAAPAADVPTLRIRRPEPMVRTVARANGYVDRRDRQTTWLRGSRKLYAQVQTMVRCQDKQDYVLTRMLKRRQQMVVIVGDGKGVELTFNSFGNSLPSTRRLHRPPRRNVLANSHRSFTPMRIKRTRFGHRHRTHGADCASR
jgi:hypothetical protein